MDLKIKVADLREVTNRIFDHIEHDLKIDEVTLDKDCYWDIADEQLYNPLEDPSSFSLGQLFDDWEFLTHILSDKEQAVSIMFIHLAPLLRYVGLKIGQ
jgi:hypothetical protein